LHRTKKKRKLIRRKNDANRLNTKASVNRRLNE
jgi:hypothetical protein